MKHGGLLNIYFCKKKSNIPNDLAEIVKFHFSHYKSMGTINCHSNQSSYPTGIKTQLMTDLDKSHMKRRALLNKHFCKKNPNIPNETEKIVNFLFSHCKSMGTLSYHSNQSSYPIGIKTQLFVPPTYRCYTKRIGLTASEEILFENVQEGRRWTTDGRTPDTSIYYKLTYEPSAQVS